MSESEPVEPRDVAAAELGDGALRVSVELRLPARRLVAGGACWLGLTVTPDREPLYLAVGTDRTRGRPAYLEVRGTLGDIELADPFHDVAGLGGPAGPLAVTPDVPYRTSVLVNQFLDLERAADLVPDGAEWPLRLTLTRPLPLAHRPQDALALSGAPLLRLSVTAAVRGDPDALEEEIAATAGAVRTHRGTATSDDLERALQALVAYRRPAAREALAALGDHPNPRVRVEAQAGR